MDYEKGNMCVVGETSSSVHTSKSMPKRQQMKMQSKGATPERMRSMIPMKNPVPRNRSHRLSWLILWQILESPGKLLEFQQEHVPNRCGMAWQAIGIELCGRAWQEISIEIGW